MNMKPAQQQPRPKSNYALFLGDLSIFCSERDIEEAFQTYGEIINVRIQRSKETSRALSYGFVEFSCETAAVTAMNEMNGFVLKGRPLRIRWAAKRNQPVKSENTNPNVATIFVKFASQSGVIVTEELLRSHFSSFGPVYDAAIRTITIDENYNRSKGYGFIQFDNTNGEGTTGAVRASNELHNTTIAGVNYRCEVGYRMSNNNSGKHHGSHSSDAMDSVSGSTMGGHSSQQSASFSSSSKGFLPPISPNGSVVQFQQQQGQGFGSNASVSNYSYSPHSPTSNSPMGGYYSSAASVASVPSISNMSGGAGNGGVVSGPAGQLYHNAVPPAPMYHAAGSPHTHHSGNGAPVTAVVSTISYVPANSYQPQSQGYHYQQPAHAQQQGYYQQPAQYQQQYYPAQNSYHANSGYYVSSNSSVSSHPSQNQQQQQYYNQQQQYYAQQAAPHQLPSLPTNESVVQPPAVPVEATAVHQPEQQKAMGRPRRAHLPTGQDALLLAQNLNALNLHQEPAVGGAQRREVRNISGVSNISDITAGTLNDLDDEDEVDGPNSRSADDDLNAADIPAALSEYNALIQSQKKDQSLTTLAPLQTFSDEKSPVNSRPAERRKRQSTSRSTVQSELTADVLYELQKQDQLQQEEDEREELRLRSQQRAPIVSTRRPSAGLKHDADTHLITVKEIAASPIKTRTPSLPGTPTVRGEKLIERGSTASPVVSIAPFTLTSSALAQIQREAEATDSATKSIPERRSKRNSSERSNQSDITAALEYMQEAVEFPEEDDDSAAQLAKLNDSINRCVCGKARSSSSSAPGSPYMSSCPFGTGACSCVYQAMC